jgi:ElaB/YqjD/DUF883 family membrane-anchored ribosome-binding protein
MTRSSEQLERDAEQARAQITGTFNELRNRLTPGQVVDELFDYGRQTNVGEFVRNLGRDVRGNPLPLMLIGAGIAWTMMGSGRSRQQPGWGAGFRRSSADTASQAISGAREMGAGVADSTRRTTGDLSDQARETISRTREMRTSMADATRRMADNFSDQASETMSPAREMGGEVADATRRTAHDFSDQASETTADLRERAQSGAAAMGEAASEARWRLAQTSGAIGEAASSVRDAASAKLGNAAATVRETAQSLGRNAATQSRTILDFCKEQPFVLAGLGMALGAAVGALLPSSETEDRLMGETSDELKGRAQEFAAEQYQKAKNVAAAASEEAPAQAQRVGLGNVHAHEASVVPGEPSEDEPTHRDETEAPHGPH